MSTQLYGRILIGRGEDGGLRSDGFHGPCIPAFHRSAVLTYHFLASYQACHSNNIASKQGVRISVPRPSSVSRILSGLSKVVILSYSLGCVCSAYLLSIGTVFDSKHCTRSSRLDSWLTLLDSRPALSISLCFRVR